MASWIHQSILTVAGVESVNWAINLVFLFGVILLWATYRMWKKAEEKNADLEQILESISPDVLLVVTPDRVISMCSNSAYHMFGQYPERIVGSPVEGILTFYEDDPDKKGARPPDIFSRGNYLVRQAYSKAFDGSQIFLEVIAGPMAGGGGAVLLLRNVTERETARLRMQSSELASGQIVRMSADGIVMVKNGMVTLINPAAEALLGRKSEEVIGQPFGYPLSTALEREIAIPRPDGKVTVAAMRTVEIRWKGETVFLSTLRDITERKSAEIIKEELVNSVTDELRAVEAVRDAIHPLLEQLTGAMSEAQKRVAASVREKIQRVNQFAFKLQALQSGPRKIAIGQNPVQIGTITGQLPALFQEQLKKKGMELKITLAQAELSVKGDGDKLAQVFIALLGNSVHFAESGPVELSATGRGETVEFRIEDSGEVFSPEDIPLVFGRDSRVFVQKKQDRRGPEMGLLIARDILEAHGGKVWVETIQGNRTRFNFTLPRFTQKP
jgi:PAS domain S-box-containing protein